jgi:hypothetical protein
VSGVGRALEEFVNDVDMLGKSLFGYTKSVINEVIGVGRAGTLIDWEGISRIAFMRRSVRQKI